MRDHHPLRIARRAGRVEDVGEILVDETEVKWIAGGCANRRGVDDLDTHRPGGVGNARVEYHERVHVGTGHDLLPARPLLDPSEQAPDAAIGGHVIEAGRRGVRVERDIGRPGLHGGVDSDDRLDGLVQIDADAIAPHRADVMEKPSEAVGLVVELPIRDRSLAVGHGNVVGVETGRRFQEVVDEEPHLPAQLARHHAGDGVDALEGLGYQLVVLELDPVLVLDEADELEDGHRVEYALVDETEVVRRARPANPTSGRSGRCVRGCPSLRPCVVPLVRRHSPMCRAATFRWISDVPE